ncbi:MAG TPA: hypothetical protein VIJ02_01120 [Thermoanaerobaculia bacterium]
MPATATREQAGIQPSTSGAPSATVVYDSAASQITLTVVVSMPADTTEPSVFAVPFTVPPGAWTVSWNLRPGQGLSSVRFPSDPPMNPNDPPGIKVPNEGSSVPPNLWIGDSQRISDTEWQVDFQSTVRTVNSINYDIGVIAMTNSNQQLSPIFVHDPTIALTPDPIT